MCVCVCRCVRREQACCLPAEIRMRHCTFVHACIVYSHQCLYCSQQLHCLVSRLSSHHSLLPCQPAWSAARAHSRHTRKTYTQPSQPASSAGCIQSRHAALSNRHYQQHMCTRRLSGREWSTGMHAYRYMCKWSWYLPIERSPVGHHYPVHTTRVITSHPCAEHPGQQAVKQGSSVQP